MSEFQTAGTIIELHSLNEKEMLEGYQVGFSVGGPEPESDKGPSYYHGWCNGMVDSHRMESTERQRMLAREVIETGYLKPK